MADRMNGSNILPIVDPSHPKFPKLYKPFSLPEYWYYQIYGKNFFDYANGAIEADTNAYLFALGMSLQGWKLPQIAAILGNLCRESTLNPAIWEHKGEQPYAPVPASDWESKSGHGFGFAQWTPARKFIVWAEQVFGNNGAVSADIPCWYNGTVQIAFMQRELQTDYQWGPGSNSAPPLRFKTEMDFFRYNAKESEVETLAWCWLYYYERPADIAGTRPGRQKWARYWYNKLKGIRLKRPPIWLIAKAAGNWR